MKRIVSILASLAGVSSADPEPRARDAGETIVVVDQAPAAARDRDRALGDAPFVTVLHPDEHPATASVADAVATSVGAQTRSLGGLGAYESVSIRGASPGHTAVLVDGVPLARIASVTTDLGRFALDAFGEVDLYRGAVPVELGGAGVGGALDLVTRLGRGEGGDVVRVSAGAGSFGARHVRVHYGDDHDDGHVLSSTTIGYQGATGDYSYFSDGGTPLNPSDDRYLVRRNNGFDQIDAATRIGAADRASAGGLRVSWKHQGLPGSIAQPAMTAAMTTLDVVGDGRFDARIGDATARQLAYLLVENQSLHDPDAELGLGTQDRGYLTLSGGASSTWSARWREHRGTAGVELRGDRFRDEDLHGMTPTLVGDRVGGAATVAADLAFGAVVVTPAFRLDAVRTKPTPPTAGPMAFAHESPRWDAVPSPRVTARLAATDDIAIKGSAGWYVRLPTLIEMFGDRGYILGSPDLRPERGPSGDLGVVWAPAHALGDVDRIFVEAAAFATRAHDTIALISTAGFVARAANLGDTETYGGELMASARLLRTLSVTAAYTRLATQQISMDVNLDGKPVPREPGHLLYARVDVARRIAGRAANVWLDTSAQSESYLDPAGLGRVPGRVLVGTGARVEIVAGIAAALAVENLGDVRVVQLPLSPPPSPTFTQTPTALADVAGFPLPGRSFYLTLEWTY